MRRSEGFSLLEMLVGMFLLAGILTAVYSAFHAGALAARRAGAESSNAAQARLQLMASEIRNAIYRNNVLLVGSATELYFHVPSRLKRPQDLLPVYRVRYSFRRDVQGTGTMHRHLVPWLATQRPDLTAPDISLLEDEKPWLGPLERFRFEYALPKEASGEEETDEGAEALQYVSGNGKLVWKNDFDPHGQTPYGIRMSWKDSDPASPEQSMVFWTAIGLMQPIPTEETPPFPGQAGGLPSGELTVEDS